MTKDIMIYQMKLNYFTKDASFPFYIQYGEHEGELFPHTHLDFMELVIVLQGTAIHQVGEKSYWIRKGDVFVIGNHTSHGYKNARDFQICNIMFRSKYFHLEQSPLKRMSGFHALFVIEPFMTKEYEFRSRLQLDLEPYQQVRELIGEMVEEYDGRKEGWKEMTKGYFVQLLVLLSRYYELPKAPSEKEYVLIAKAASYMEMNFTQDLSVNLLAQMSHLSLRHFSRIFKETYKMSPLQYVIALRVSLAKELLGKERSCVSEIGMQCGFLDNNYFSRIFKKEVGVTPREYRKQIQSR